MDIGLTPALPVSDPNDWYVAYDDFNIDHYILYHGLDESICYAREADVLILGSSQVQYAFPKIVLKHFELETGLRFYNLGFGHVETSKYTLALIEKQDLYPRITIVNANWFFMPQASEFGEKVMESSRWEAWKTVWEWKLTWQTRHSRPFELLANWRALRPPFRIWIPRSIVCRSISSGSWLAIREHPRAVPIGSPPVSFYMESDGVDDSTFSIAREFKRELAERGTEMVLTLIPYPAYWSQWPQIASLADELEVPFISPIVPGLMTRDGGHLDDESAERFSVQFITEFKAWLKKSGATN